MDKAIISELAHIIFEYDYIPKDDTGVFDNAKD